eukprot:scaffold75402_cov68-Phaeocystis_antarctica.AAC.2
MSRGVQDDAVGWDELLLWACRAMHSGCSSLPAKHVSGGGVRHGAAGTERRMARGACGGLGGSEGRAAKARRQNEGGGFESSFRHRPAPPCAIGAWRGAPDCSVFEGVHCSEGGKLVNVEEWYTMGCIPCKKTRRETERS